MPGETCLSFQSGFEKEREGKEKVVSFELELNKVRRVSSEPV